MANISGTDEDIQNRTSTWLTRIPPAFGKESLVNIGPLITEISLWNHTHPPKSTFSEDHISAPSWCCAPKFLHMLENDQILLVHSHRG